jgi:hypothetical protein
MEHGRRTVIKNAITWAVADDVTATLYENMKK